VAAACYIRIEPQQPRLKTNLYSSFYLGLSFWAYGVVTWSLMSKGGFLCSGIEDFLLT